MCTMNFKMWCKDGVRLSDTDGAPLLIRFLNLALRKFIFPRTQRRPNKKKTKPCKAPTASCQKRRGNFCSTSATTSNFQDVVIQR